MIFQIKHPNICKNADKQIFFKTHFDFYSANAETFILVLNPTLGKAPSTATMLQDQTAQGSEQGNKKTPRTNKTESCMHSQPVQK